MKNKKILMAIGILFAMLIIISLITILIIILNKNKETIKENINIINISYNNIKNEVSNYNNIRNDISEFINNFYYNTIEEKYVDNLKLLNDYDSIIGNITTEIKVLDSKCNISYIDDEINNICNNYKTDYETIVNVFMNDINNYNNKLNKYNIDENKRLELFKSRYVNDYIDYNKDGNFEQKVVVNG